MSDAPDATPPTIDRGTWIRAAAIGWGVAALIGAGLGGTGLLLAASSMEQHAQDVHEARAAFATDTDGAEVALAEAQAAWQRAADAPAGQAVLKLGLVHDVGHPEPQP